MSGVKGITLHLYFSQLAARRAETQAVSSRNELGYSIFADLETGKLYRVNGGWTGLGTDARQIQDGRDFWGQDYDYVASVAHDKVAVLVGTRGEIDEDLARRLNVPPRLDEINRRVERVLPSVPVSPKSAEPAYISFDHVGTRKPRSPNHNTPQFRM